MGDTVPDQFLATGKRVVIIGGGDTGANCLGTSHRQGAAHIIQFELLPQPPATRSPSTPWPMGTLMMRVERPHEEGGVRDWGVSTVRFSGDEHGNVKKLHAVRVGPPPTFEPQDGTEFELDVDLVLLAMGFTGPVKAGLLDDLGVSLDARGNVQADSNYMTSIPGVFPAGDVRRGQSLVVWAIAEGRKAARGIDEFLMARRVCPCSLGSRPEPNAHAYWFESTKGPAAQVSERGLLIWLGMVAVSRTQVEAALPRVEPGFWKYCLIQERLHCCDVSTDRDFQRQFDHFYRVRKNQEWRTCFFGLLERAKISGTSFRDTLDCLQSATGNVEASFASKLVATIDPSKPVIDKFVLEHFKLRLPYPKAKNRFDRVVNRYDSLCDLFSELITSPTGSMVLDCFDRHFGHTNLTPLKKVDLVLWQIRP